MKNIVIAYACGYLTATLIVAVVVVVDLIRS
jgi:hypothetical protein